MLRSPPSGQSLPSKAWDQRVSQAHWGGRMHLAYGIPMFDPRLLRAKKGAPGLTPAMGSPTLVWAGAIEPPSAGGGALGVLLPPMKGSLPVGMDMLISPQSS